MAKKTNKINLAFCIFILFILHISNVYSQNEILLNSYEELQPTINLLKTNDIDYNDKTLLFFQPLRGINTKIILFNLKNQIIRFLTKDDLEFDPNSIQEHFFDPVSNNNYIYISNIGGKKDSAQGWYKLILRQDYSIGLDLLSTDRYWANYSNPFQIISKDKLLQIEYTQIDALQRISKFEILDDNKEKWELKCKGQSFVDMYLISEQWLLSVDSPHIAGIFNNTTIFNYVTGEKQSFEPEQIIGFGKGVVITSLKTDNGFSGISIWSDKKELLFRDNSFPITKMIKDIYPSVTSGKPIIYMSYFSYPFVFCNLGRVSNIGIPFCTLVLDLISGKTFYSSETYNLLAIF